MWDFEQWWFSVGRLFQQRWFPVGRIIQHWNSPLVLIPSGPPLILQLFKYW